MPEVKRYLSKNHSFRTYITRHFRIIFDCWLRVIKGFCYVFQVLFSYMEAVKAIFESLFRYFPIAMHLNTQQLSINSTDWLLSLVNLEILMRFLVILGMCKIF